MNEKHLQNIFESYIEKFDFLNNNKNDETYKWFIAGKYKTLMDEALAASETDFSDALYKVCKCTENMIDSYTTPFYGLVAFSREEPETVRQMFIDLYQEDNGDLSVQEKRIEKFLAQSEELRKKYFPDSFLYKQNSHSVSAYLFLYDPEHHYMYKYTEATGIADAIEFVDSWGNGDNIKLSVFYRMCDYILEQIMKTPELLAIDKSRFDFPNSENMHQDKNKHILLFDIMYCGNAYDLYEGIHVKKLSSSEKKLISEKRMKAAELLQAYNKAVDDMQNLEEGMFLLEKHLQPGRTVIHKSYGKGKVITYKQSGNVQIDFGSIGVKTLSGAAIYANRFIKSDDEQMDKRIMEFTPYLKKKDDIIRKVGSTEKNLEPYKEYIE